jgi:hypothetical protein
MRPRKTPAETYFFFLFSSFFSVFLLHRNPAGRVYVYVYIERQRDMTEEEDVFGGGNKVQ